MHVYHFRSAVLACGIALIFSYPLAALFKQSLDWATFIPPALLGLYAAYAAIMTKGVAARVMIMSSLLCVLCTGALYFLAPSGSVPDKLNQFVLTIAIFGIATAYALNSPVVVSHLGLGLALLGGVATALLLLFPQEVQAGRLSFGDNNPIWTARVVAWLGLAAFGLYLHDRSKYLVAGGLFLVSIIGIVMTASRGPLLALLFACVAGMLMVQMRHKWAIIFGGVFAVVACVVAMSAVGLIDARLFALGSREDSSLVRSDLFFFTIDEILATPSGVGVGRFNYKDILEYPHNIWLEVFAEWGWGAGFGFLVVSIVGSYGVVKLDEKYMLVKMLLFFEIINAGFSGDVNSPRFLYGLIILGLANLFWRAHKRRGDGRRIGQALA